MTDRYVPRGSRRGGRYEPRRPPPVYEEPAPRPAHNRDTDMFQFRGAAARAREDNVRDPFPPRGSFGDGYRFNDHAQSRNGNDGNFRSFDFRAGDGPSFQPSTNYPNARREPRRDGPRSHPRRDRGQGRGRGGRGSRRGRRPDERELLTATREDTPEQLPGMKDGPSRFMNVDGLSQSDSEAMDTAASGDSGADEAPKQKQKAAADSANDSDSDGEHPRAKRARLGSPGHAATPESRPKWSNPDPYTVLPPPDESRAKKKDVVKLIRKAKNDAPKAEVKASEASDFISLNFDDDEAGDDNGVEKGSASESGEVSSEDAEHGKATTARPKPQGSSSSFSHLDNLHPDRFAAPAEPSLLQAQPSKGFQAGPLDVWPPPPPAHKNDPRPPPTEPDLRLRNPRKRKHVDLDQEIRVGSIVPDWLPYPNEDPSPWFDHASRGRRPSLHSEILQFYNYVRPRSFEDEVRTSLLKRIDTALSRTFPNVHVKAFGSFASGLYLPTADMDLVVLSDRFTSHGIQSIGGNRNQMQKYANCLTKNRIADWRTMTIIAKAKVPVIKFTDQLTHLKVDLSFDNDSGIVAQTTFETWKAQYPAMPVIVSLIKQFLVMRGVSEVFSGGIGGYTTICLVVSIIRKLSIEKGDEWDAMKHLDLVLMTFFRFFGEEFPLTHSAIRMEPWEIMPKSLYDPNAKKANPDRLLIIDPNNYDNDISGGSHRVGQIFDCFAEAFEDINSSLDVAEDVYEQTGESRSVLSRVFGGSYSHFEVQRDTLRRLWENEHGRRASDQPVGQAILRRQAPAALVAATTMAGSKRTASPDSAGPRDSKKAKAAGPPVRRAPRNDVPVHAESDEEEDEITAQAAGKAVSRRRRGNKGNDKGHGKLGAGGSQDVKTLQDGYAHSVKLNKESAGVTKTMTKKKTKAQLAEDHAAVQRATSFRSQFPGIPCADRLSKQQYKGMKAKHAS